MEKKSWITYVCVSVCDKPLSFFRALTSILYDGMIICIEHFKMCSWSSQDVISTGEALTSTHPRTGKNDEEWAFGGDMAMS